VSLRELVWRRGQAQLWWAQALGMQTAPGQVLLQTAPGQVFLPWSSLPAEEGWMSSLPARRVWSPLWGQSLPAHECLAPPPPGSRLVHARIICRWGPAIFSPPSIHTDAASGEPPAPPMPAARIWLGGGHGEPSHTPRACHQGHGPRGPCHRQTWPREWACTHSRRGGYLRCRIP